MTLTRPAESHAQGGSPARIPMRALGDAGIDPQTVTISPTAARTTRWLTQTYHVSGPGLDAILKIHPWNLRSRIATDPDSRFQTLAKLFPIAPFFQATSTAMDVARSVLPVQVPVVLAEGMLAGGEHYTLMSRVAGRPWHPSMWRTPESMGSVSREMGSLISRLHEADTEGAAGRTEWLEGFAEILHCLADNLGRGMRRGAGRHDYHRRLAAVCERVQHSDLGPNALAHCDLHPSNLLFDEAGHVRGIIDFQLACVGPAALDFRWLAMLDEVEFFAAYDRYRPDTNEACWLGHCFDLFWQGLALVVMDRFTDSRVPGRRRTRYLAQFEYLLRLCEDDELRRGPVWRRRLVAWRTRARTSVRLALRRAGNSDRDAPTDGGGSQPRVAIIVPAWNHLETTTRPCLGSLRRFTDQPYRVVCVDNASDDGTRNALEQLASRDDRLEVVCAEHNLGWAAGTLAGLERLRPSDTHVLLLNSDTIVSPGWLSKLLWHLERRPDSSFVIPNENPTLDGAARRRARGDATAAITPGTAPVSAPPPDLATVLRTSAEVERRFHRKSQVTAPSGFCLLFSVADLPLVKEYLRDFERYHAGEIDWSAWWSKTGKSCREALDNYVFHARGGSGGYYAYDRDNTP